MRSRSFLRTALVLALAAGLSSESSCKAKSDPDGKGPPPEGEVTGLRAGVRLLPAPPPLPVRPLFVAVPPRADR